MNSSTQISPLKASVMGVNIMVGAGILAGPGVMAQLAGEMSYLSWFVTALILLPTVYNVSRLPEVIPGDAGFYGYCKAGFGLQGAFWGGWLYFLSYNFAMTTVLHAFRGAFLSLYPHWWFFENKVLFYGSFLGGLLFINMASSRFVTTLQSTLTYIKLIPVMVAIFLCPFFWEEAFAINWVELPLIPKGIPMAIFGFFGFEYCCNISSMVRGGKQAAQKSILYSFVFVALLYTVFHFSVTVIMGKSGLMAYQASGYPFFVSEQYPALSFLLNALIPVATFLTFFNSSNGMLFLNTIILNALTRDKVLRSQKTFNAINRYGQPWFCTLFAAVFSFFAGLVIENTQSLAIACNLSVTVLIMMATYALMLKDKSSAFSFNHISAILGIGINCGLLFLNWHELGDTNLQRFEAAQPLLVGIIVGLCLFKPHGNLLIKEVGFKGKAKGIT